MRSVAQIVEIRAEAPCIRFGDVTREALGSLRDVLLLSECARVLGNPYSAFSQASAALAVYRRAAEGKRARVTWVPFPGIDRF